MADWDPQLYHRFRAYRAEPVAHMLERLVLERADHIVDLGCGTGEYTVELARRSGGTALGLDSSAAMIASAQQLWSTLESDLKYRIKFEQGDFREFKAEGTFSVVFSNAALQWVSDQRAVLAACYRALVPGGRLAVQVPANDRETAQVTIQALADEAPWASALGGLKTPSRQAVLAPEIYRALLEELGFREVDCYYHTFRHPMANPAEVVEWCRATALRPFLNRLPAPQQPAFIAALTRRLEVAYATTGPLTFNFRRLFLWGRRD